MRVCLASNAHLAVHCTQPTAEGHLNITKNSVSFYHRLTQRTAIGGDRCHYEGRGCSSWAAPDASFEYASVMSLNVLSASARLSAGHRSGWCSKQSLRYACFTCTSRKRADTFMKESSGGHWGPDSEGAVAMCKSKRRPPLLCLHCKAARERCGRQSGSCTHVRSRMTGLLAHGRCCSMTLNLRSCRARSKFGSGF